MITEEEIGQALLFKTTRKGAKYWRTIHAARDILSHSEMYSNDVIGKAEEVVHACCKGDTHTLSKNSSLEQAVSVSI